MKCRRSIYLALVAISLIFITTATGCSRNVGNDREPLMRIKLNTDRIVVAVGETVPLLAECDVKGMKISYVSDGTEVASVSAGGIVTAIKAGKATITASVNNAVALCEVTVADSTVSGDYNSHTVGYGVTKHSTVTSAVARGGRIVVLNGIYPENIVSQEAIDILGEGDVTIASLSGSDVIAENITFAAATYPSSNSAMVTASNTVSLTKCNFIVSENAATVDKMVGGYALLMRNGAYYINVRDCNFANFRMAVYLQQTAAKINIISNKFMRCDTAIEVNLRGDSSMLADYVASGEIKDNLYYECNKDTAFVHSGTSYKGSLQYELKLNAKPKE